MWILIVMVMVLQLLFFPLTLLPSFGCITIQTIQPSALSVAELSLPMPCESVLHLRMVSGLHPLMCKLVDIGLKDSQTQSNENNVTDEPKQRQRETESERKNEGERHREREKER